MPGALCRIPAARAELAGLAGPESTAGMRAESVSLETYLCRRLRRLCDTDRRLGQECRPTRPCYITLRATVV